MSSRRRKQQTRPPSPPSSDDDNDGIGDRQMELLDEVVAEHEEKKKQTRKGRRRNEEEESDSESDGEASDQDEDDLGEQSSHVVPDIDPNVDEHTLRILVSTDNHLGYAERDPIRGNDSFAAFEEVLFLAKRHNCDMVLLAGDLFHDNKPSRRTLHKTMNILRRYTMGPNPISFQIISNQKQNFRSTLDPYNTVNYENPFVSIDLPIFSIHGNHDDPTRDGGDEMLAALDLLAMGSLVNYFGRQDEVDKIQVNPILIKKGDTKVALYGMGSMRDERLNRMWQGKKVRFLKPEVEEEDGEDDDSGWFNIFALHQNRDFGRGSKNCVHESMIPEWMDLVVWGHEHECNIIPAESALGTYRITQPGSSVATSLSEGESLSKNVGILDIRESQFRLLPVPLMQVRPFAMGTICLADTDLDPTDMRIEDAMGDVLTVEVEKLIQEARKDSRLSTRKTNQRVDENENTESNIIADRGDDASLVKNLHFQIRKPDEVLVRLKVEHSGFSTLHNQRFGSRFVNQVANPSDVLLFHRKRTNEASKTSTPKNKGSSARKNGDAIQIDPAYPAELEESNVEDFIKTMLNTSEKKISVLKEDKMSIALDDFVTKEQRQVINETVTKLVNTQEKWLVQRGVDPSNDRESGSEVKLTTANAVREVCQAEGDKTFDDRFEMDIDDENGGADKGQFRNKKKRAPTKRIVSTSSKAKGRSRARTHESDESEFDEDDEIVEDVSPPRSKRTGGGRTGRRATTKRGYTEDVIELDDDDDESSFVSQTPKKKARRRR